MYVPLGTGFRRLLRIFFSSFLFLLIKPFFLIPSLQKSYFWGYLCSNLKRRDYASIDTQLEAISNRKSSFFGAPTMNGTKQSLLS